VFFLLSKVLDIFLCPYTWGVLLLAYAVPWRGHRAARRRWRRRRIFGALGLGVLILAGVSPLSNAIMWRMERSAPSTYRADVTYDAVILLGGLVDQVTTAETGRPAFTDSVERLIVTHDLLREGKARFVIVSAATNPRFPEAGEVVVIARQLEAWGIEKDRIILEDKALNTRENALYSHAIARARGFSRVVVVTSAFHMDRAVGCFASVGMEVDTLPVDYRAHRSSGAQLGDWIPRVDGLADMSGTLHEVFGRLVYRVRGYTSRS
jgi:uncharacterized SAM-binding protein YcdF (DUF218 family)